MDSQEVATTPATPESTSASLDERMWGLRDPVTAVLLIVAAVYPLFFLDRGWIPHDDGMLGQTSIRVLTGELPHRDFQDVYSGGLAFWNAGAFVLFGIDLMAPRYLLYGCFLAFLAVSYRVACRFADFRHAAAAVLGVAVWSMPNYPTPMPTWYNLFLAVAALWFFFRYVEDSRPRWLMGAGVACGLSLTVKIVGLYTVAGLLMALLLAEVEASQGGEGEGAVRRRGGGEADTLYRIAAVFGLVTYVTVVMLLVRSRLGLGEFLQFLLPSATVAGMAAWWVWRWRSLEGSGFRLRTLVRTGAWFLAGVALPVAVFCFPFALEGALPDLLRGTLILPFRRLSFAVLSPLPLSLAWPGLAMVLFLAVAGVVRGPIRAVLLGCLGLTMAVVLVWGGTQPVYLHSWATFLLAPVLVVLAGGWGLLRQDLRGPGGARSTKAAATVAVLATFVLVQYPMSGPVYFFYVAPLAILAAVAVWPRSPSWGAPGRLLSGFVLLFPMLWIGPASLVATPQGRFEWTRGDTVRMEIERGGIRVTAPEAAEYRELTSALAALAPNGVTFATPDAPEVYFLAGLRNPTPVLYDFFDEQEGRANRTLAALESQDVRVVVLNRAPHFSGPPGTGLVGALEERYPRAMVIGRYVVRWR